MKGVKFDREILHEYLWRKAKDTRQNVTEVYQTGIAEEFRITKATLSGAMADLQEEGKIKKIRAKKGNIGIYFVRDPHA